MHCVFGWEFITWPTIVQSGSLSALGGASTSRVLNLFRIATDNADNPEHLEKPLFVSPIINKTFLLKHRTRADETYLFSSPARPLATKIIIPFDSTDLRAGGRSLFVDQRGYSESLREAGNYNSRNAGARPVGAAPVECRCRRWTLSCCASICATTISTVSPCYFAISEGDQERMHKFVSQEMAKLVNAGGRQRDGSSAGRLVTALAVQ